MLLEIVYKEWRKILWGIIALPSLLLVLFYACRTPPPTTRQDNAATQATPGTSDPEMFRGVRVAPKQILIKLDKCDGVDSKKLTETVRRFAVELTNDNAVTASRGAIGCWYLIKSSTLTVQRLLDLFGQATASKRSLTVDGLTAVVVHGEPNFLLQADESPNDYLFQRRRLWGLKNYDHPGIDVHAEEAWNSSTGANIAVGVIDSGIFYDHPDLVKNVWSAPTDFTVTLGDVDISCPKGSHGYNAVGAPSEVCDPLDKPVNSGHGTHVSGIIGAVGNNEEGSVGVNWNTRIIALKAANALNEAAVNDVINAIKFAVAVRDKFGCNANTRVLNASFGYLAAADPLLISTNLRDAIQFASDNNVLFVASAGVNGRDNDVVPHYPSSFDLPNLLSVTAIDETGGLAVINGTSANHGSMSVHLAAPGKEIVSTQLFNPAFPVSVNDKYQVKSGTSMSTAFVSGAAALILSVPACSALNATDVKRVIMQGTDPTTPESDTVTKGYLNVARSIGLCTTAPP